MYVRDNKQRDHLLNAIETVPCVQKKAEWASKWCEHENASFVERCIAFSIIMDYKKKTQKKTVISMKILVIKMQKNGVHFPSLIEFVSGSLLRYTDEKFRHRNIRAYSNGRRQKKNDIHE